MRVAGHYYQFTKESLRLASKTATVQFDDTAATADKLTEATKEAGYPSSIKKENK